MPRSPQDICARSIASNLAAPQHRPRPLPLFLELLRSETASDPAALAAALKGLRAYQQAPRDFAPPEATVIDREGRAVLRSYGAKGRRILFVPSLINGSSVLDLTPANSMMRGLAAQGLDPILLDWGIPDASEADLDIGGHVERFLVPLLDRLGDVVLAGYCLGGVMAVAAATLAAPRALILIATPWDFSGFPADTRQNLLQLWQAAKPTADAMGLVPAEVLQQVFWQIDPKRTVHKFVQFADKDPLSPEGQNYIAVEDWANDGPPMTYAAGRDLMENLHGANVSGEGRWAVGGRFIDPAALQMPVLNIVSTTDSITPAETAWQGGDRIALEEGHVGMVVGRKAPHSLWHRIGEWVAKL